MAQPSTPRIWNAFVIPSALGIFYCVVLCLNYPHLASMIPTHINAAGTPDRWTATGPILLASLAAICLLFLVLGISAIYSIGKRLAWWITCLVFAGVIGAAVGASVEFIRAVHAFREFHSFAWLLWALLAAIAEAIFLLIPSERRSRSATKLT